MRASLILILALKILLSALLYSPDLLLKTNVSSFQSDLSNNSSLTGPVHHYLLFSPFY